MEDNSIDTISTHFDSLESLAKVSRWSKEHQQKVDVLQDRVFANYNLGIGVDLVDQQVNNYGVTINWKK